MSKSTALDQAVRRVIKGRHALRADRDVAEMMAFCKTTVGPASERVIMKIRHAYLFVRLAGGLDEKTDEAQSSKSEGAGPTTDRPLEPTN